ncbi:MAG TPA: DapH/DapD/GlmU-related protein [Roseiarcus sp.]
MLDKTNPRGVHIGAGTYVSSGVDILAHDSAHLQHVDTWVGERCHVGAEAVICPGVKVGDGCIVAPGAVVMRDVAADCVVVGNPARVVEKGIRTGKYGVRLDAAGPDDPNRQRPGQKKRDEARDRISALS